ncbi:MAG: protein kinase domain-containing protein [Waterburya sp.]
MTLEPNIEAGLKIISDFIAQEAQKALDERERAIITGCLQGLTYEQIQQKTAILRGLSVEYISRYLAHRLWKKINKVIEKTVIADQKIKVSKNKLWYFIEKIDELQNTNNQQDIYSFPPQVLEGQLLKNRYEIAEYLFDRDLTERHFLAIDRDLGNKACLVVQLKSGSLSVQNRFQREAKILDQLGKNQQIPQLLAYFPEERYYYLIYEYVEGTPLTNLFLEGQLWQETQVISFFQDILQVLEIIHQHNLVHRNLNPDNLILQPDGQIILIDFATVKPIDDSKVSSSFARGMKGYIPAEQLMGITTPASDVYAIGKIAIHALTGIHPWKLKIDRNTGNAIWRNQAQVNSSLADLIDAMVDFHFAQRYQTATEVLTALSNVDI